MDRTRAAAPTTTTFSQPIRAITTMLFVSILVGIGAWLIHAQVIDIIRTSPFVNSLIALVFFLGVVTCFWQVFILAQSVSWIENFVRQAPGATSAKPPRLLAPLASLLRSPKARMQISSTASRSILESVAQRIDEARDITRYLVNLLVFLGLLGTFWGLATTVPAVVETIRSLAPAEGETGLDVFGKLMGGLEKQLGGMGSAFSSSLMGLAGSLVVGLLELFAGHGQNRFYRELEEWLSSITRVSYAGGEGDSGGEAGASLVILSQMSEQMEAMQNLFAQSEIGRGLLEERITALATGVERLATRLEAGAGEAQGQISGQTAVLERIAEAQDRLLAAMSDADGGALADAESRMRLRSIDVQMLRILEEISAGRQESMADLRADLMALTGAIRQLSRGSVGRG